LGALMKAHQGDIVEVRAPSGEHIEALEIRYAASAVRPNRLATFDH
jgi:hypothetical protein